MHIGMVAKHAGVSVDTVRFYERRGVLAKAARTNAGYRSFSAAAVERLRVVRSLQQMGLSLDEVAATLSSVDAGEATCASERRHLEAVLARVDAQLAALRSLRKRVTQTLRRCDSGTCTLVEDARGAKGA